MCLLIHKPAEVEFTDEWLADFHSRNRDGVGIMWFERKERKVKVVKRCSPSVDEWIQLYSEYAYRRDCLIHLRMRTHGTITKDNVHPYYVSHGIWLMHNGVLATGNKKDPAKSDTWHFINDVLRPGIGKRPDVVQSKKFQKRLGHAINSNNRFAMLGPDGKPIIINRHTGVEWKGAWMSNTYAWSAARAGVGKRPVLYASAWRNTWVAQDEVDEALEARGWDERDWQHELPYAYSKTEQ